MAEPYMGKIFNLLFPVSESPCCIPLPQATETEVKASDQRWQGDRWPPRHNWSTHRRWAWCISFAQAPQVQSYQHTAPDLHRARDHHCLKI